MVNPRIAGCCGGTFSKFREVWRSGSPLFFASPRYRNSRFSAVEAISFADNFLQKQQKQRECRLQPGTRGNSDGWPSWPPQPIAPEVAIETSVI
jgi:hypothetical protein